MTTGNTVPYSFLFLYRNTSYITLERETETETETETDRQTDRQTQTHTE